MGYTVLLKSYGFERAVGADIREASMKKRVLILTVAVLILLAAIPFAAAAENKLGKKIEGFEVTAKELKNGVVTLREDSEAGDPYVLFIDSDKDWKATLENTKLVK